METIDPFIFRLAIFILSIFVGYYVVWSVTPALHTPLMSVTNAISSVIIVGALIAVAVSNVNSSQLALYAGAVAVFLAAINIWKDKPFFGNGLKSFRALCGFEKYKTISKNDANRCSTHPHNFYFELLAETGIFGFCLLVSFFIISLKKINFFKNKNRIFFSIIFIMSIWPIGTSGSLFNNHNAGFFWFIISLSYYALNKKNLFITSNN